MINFPFQEWFSFGNIVGGDWKFFWGENLREVYSYALAWDSSLNTGIGKDNLSFLWLNTYVGYLSHFFSQILHIPWVISEKIIFFWPIVFLSFFSSFYLSRYFVNNKLLNILSGVIYLANTYSLMIFSGGQVGVGLAYSIVPLIILKFIQFNDLRSAVIAGLFLALQLLFDPRIALLSLIIILIYYFFSFKSLIQKIRLFIIPFFIAVILHLFWILPIIFGKIDPVSSTLSKSSFGSGIVQFLSFAKLEDTLSLLQPNWPENIFGKTGFMKPEFLLFPILAFSSLLFNRNKKILSLAFIGLIGVFLSKGANSPLGEIYTWLTDKITLFTMYRDPTKWYMLIAVSYSILIPLGLQGINNFLKKWKLQNLVYILFVVYLLVLFFPLFSGETKGTFAKHTLPQEYVRFEDFISSKDEFFRTIWIPKVQRFALSTNQHPAISWSELFKAIDNRDTKISIFDKMSFLRMIGVKYIVVPFDSEGEIFVDERKYSDKQYLALIKDLRNMKFLKEIREFDRIKVFEVFENKDRFWIHPDEENIGISYQAINPTEYILNISNARKNDMLIFAEGFNSNWIAKLNSQKISSLPFEGKINSFILPIDGSYELKIQYGPEYWRKVGIFISLSSLMLILLFLFTAKTKRAK